MTLVIASPGRDFVILGADSRGTITSGGTRVEINIMEKLFQVAKHVAILTYGDAESGNQLIEKFKFTLRKNDNGVTYIANKFAELCRKDARELSGVPIHPDFFPNFGFIITGLDQKRGKYALPSCYTLSSVRGFRLGLCKPFAIKGKPMIAYYLFAKSYRDDMRFDELCKLVAQALYDTIRIDGDVGGKIKLAIIDSKGFRELPEDDIFRDHIETWDAINLNKIIRQ